MIRKLILSLIVCVNFVGFCWAQEEGFRLVGQMNEIASGRFHLVVDAGNRLDTLGTATLVNGVFEFTGKVEGVKIAYLVMEGRTGGIPVFLENTTIFVKIAGKNVTVDGGKEQELYNKFIELQQILVDAQKVFGQQAQAAARNGREMEVAGIQKRFEEVFKETNGKIETLIKENPNQFVPVYMLFNSIRQLPPEIVKQRFEWLGESARENPYGRGVADFLQTWENVKVGSIAPNFSVRTQEGDSLSLHGVKAKLKLLDFWASWCSPCRQENTNLIGLYRKFHSEGLQIISISIDTDERAWKQAIGEDGMVWFNGSDLLGENSPLLTLYLVHGIPHTILLDENNRIIAKNLRGKELEKKIAELLHD